MAPLCLILGTQLLAHEHKVYKLKLTMPFHHTTMGCVGEEVECVLRVLLHRDGSVEHIQTQHLLCDCSTKVWKAGKRLSFKKDGRNLVCMGIMFSIHVRLKQSTVVADTSIREKKCQYVQDDNSHTKQRMEERKFAARGSIDPLTVSSSVHSKMLIDAVSGIKHTGQVTSRNSASGKTTEQVASKAEQLANASKTLTQKELVNAVALKKILRANENEVTQGKCHVEQLEIHNDVHQRKRLDMNNTVSKENSFQAAKGLNQITEMMNFTKTATKRKDPSSEISSAKCLNRNDHFKRPKLIEHRPLVAMNRMSVDRAEQEEERKLESLAHCKESDCTEQSWMLKTWDFVLTPVKGLFRRNSKEQMLEDLGSS